MKPSALQSYLNSIIKFELYLSVMIWGPPGIGKSSIVQSLASRNNLDFIDLRLSQLAPTDLRGLPVPKEGVSYWFPPEFLPTSGTGILFLDEVNMAPPAMQGMAQQLILDRKVGNYEVPDGWFIWAAGNRKQDRASVFEMPAPLSNRFLHLHVDADIDDFRQYAYKSSINVDIISFLAFRQALLHQVDQNSEAWPSPRTWEMASLLISAGLEIEPAIGVGAAAEFNAYLQILKNVPDLEKIAGGNSSESFPTEPSLRYATVVGLVAFCDNVAASIDSFKWLVNNAQTEWVQLFASDLFPKSRDQGFHADLQEAIIADADLSEFLREYMRLLT